MQSNSILLCFAVLLLCMIALIPTGVESAAVAKAKRMFDMFDNDDRFKKSMSWFDEGDRFRRAHAAAKKSMGWFDESDRFRRGHAAAKKSMDWFSDQRFRRAHPSSKRSMDWFSGDRFRRDWDNEHDKRFGWFNNEQRFKRPSH